MTEIRLLRPRRLTANMTPQCSCEPEAVGWSDAYIARRKKEMTAEGMDPLKCRRRATVEIDGTPYCMLHAGPIAVNLLLQTKS